MSNLPLFFVHKGTDYYLQYALNQIRFFNPNSDIILLGDKKNSWVKKIGISHYMMDNYYDMSREFNNIFVNLSSNPSWYECFCMQRWMILYEFCIKHSIDTPIWYFDSDTMIYVNVSEYADKYLKKFDMATNRKLGPQYTYFSDSSILSLFAKFIFQYYKDREKLNFLKIKYKREFIDKKLRGGICDMTFLAWFQDNLNTFDTSNIIDTTTYDTNINGSDGYAFSNKYRIKDISIKDDIPYCTFLATNQIIKFLGLHFQGAAKMSMYKYYTGKGKVESKLISKCRIYYRKIYQLAKIIYNKFK